MWWKRGVVYEIYPRSFQDTDGDGVGDLRGVADRLPYLARLGIDAVWLTPFFASPMRDFGYDITDHCAIDPSFGTMDDFDALVAAAHEHGIKVVLDFVPNHTSDLHPWFQESRASRESPSATGTSGATATRPTTGSRCSAAGRGSGTRRRARATTTPTSPSNPTSTGASRTCARRCSACCGSGRRAGSTGSGSTRCARCSRIWSCATTRRRPAGTGPRTCTPR